MKEGQKRIKNDDFQQVEKCTKCGILFWSISLLELGNWGEECSKCKIKREKKEQKNGEYIKANGTPHYGSKRQIFAWSLGKEAVFNSDFEPQEGEERDVWANGFIDIDRFEKRFGEKVIS